jgi:hypothetical protein
VSNGASVGQGHQPLLRVDTIWRETVGEHQNCLPSSRIEELPANFVELFAKFFPGRMPKSVDRPFTVEPLVVSTAVPGEDLNREAGGGFSGQGGGWTQLDQLYFFAPGTVFVPLVSRVKSAAAARRPG